MGTVGFVVGARPNFVKSASVVRALQALDVPTLVVHTGQHYDREMSEVFIAELGLPEPDVFLGVGSGTHAEQTARALVGIETALVEHRPEVVIVPGDVNSTLAGALAAVKLGIPVCHLEAGLRSFDQAMPEEHNRKLTDHMSSLLLTHSEEAHDNLAAEGIVGDRIAFVGNTMIDTLFANVERARAAQTWRDHGLPEGGYVLATLHRPALVDTPELLREMILALDSVAHDLPVLLPIHPRTNARLEELGLRDRLRVTIVPPQPYLQFLSLQAGAAAVATDSGGVQEETTALGVPCFTLRDNTERPVTITHGTNTLLGLEPSRLAAIPELLRHPRRDARPPLWDGHAGVRCAERIEQELGVAAPAAAAERRRSRPTHLRAVRVASS